MLRIIYFRNNVQTSIDYFQTYSLNPFIYDKSQTKVDTLSLTSASQFFEESICSLVIKVLFANVYQRCY